MGTAEVDALGRLVELAHLNRQAVTGGMSASIAHELNQPLGSILTNSQTAELLLTADELDVEEQMSLWPSEADSVSIGGKGHPSATA